MNFVSQSYDDVPGNHHHHQQRLQNQSYLEACWDDCSLTGKDDFGHLFDCKTASTSSRMFLPHELVDLVPHVCPSEDHRRCIASPSAANNNQIALLGAPSPGADFSRSRKNSLGSVSSCNKCKPALLTSDSDNPNKIRTMYSNIVVPMTDSHSSLRSHPRTKGSKFSWLFPMLKNKHRNEKSPHRAGSETYHELGSEFSIEGLKRALVEANDKRDAALLQVSEMKSSVGELREKLDYVETYCEELKKALIQAKDSQPIGGVLPRRGRSIDGIGEALSFPVSEEVMVEGFLQIVSEVRLSVKHFCKTLVSQIEENDHNLIENLNLILQPHKLTLNSKYSKAVLYHMESLINQSLYQDFENCVFQKNGSPKFLDPEQDRHEQFSSFCSLRNLSWNEVLRKGTKYYSEEFSKFCDQKMSGAIAALNWTRPWSEQLLQAFFVSAKCIWLLHLLAFSFGPPLTIMRVEGNRSFDSVFMEDVFMDRQRPHNPTRVKVMVMPGFYMQDRVVRCRVLCRYKSSAI